MDFNRAARQIGIRRKVQMGDESLDPLISPDSDLWRVMVDHYGIPIKQEWFESVVSRFHKAIQTGLSFQTWDVISFNEWKISPDLLKLYYEKLEDDTDLAQAIRDSQLE